MNKYQKANELIHLSLDQKNTILENLLKEDVTPAKPPFVLKPWMAGLGAVFAVLILYFGILNRPMGTAAPALGESTATVTEDSAPAMAEEAESSEEAEKDTAVNSFASVYETSGTAEAREDDITRIIIGQEADEIDFESYGERTDILIQDTEVSIYGNRAARFSLNGESYAVVSGRQLSEEELSGLVSNIISDFGG